MSDNEKNYTHKAVLIIGHLEDSENIHVSLDYEPRVGAGDEVPEAYQIMNMVFHTALKPIMFAPGVEQEDGEDMDEPMVVGEFDDVETPPTIQ